jgi:hypothetical protein
MPNAGHPGRRRRIWNTGAAQRHHGKVARPVETLLLTIGMRRTAISST